MPLGLLLVGFGGWSMLAGPEHLGSMRCLLPGLLLALLPSAVLAVMVPGGGLRPVLTATVGAALAVAGVLARWRAPLLVGAVVAVAVAAVQSLPFVSGLPQWVWLAAAGVLALSVGAGYEHQRRRARAVGTH